MKKIIQVSFSLPVPDQQELWNLLFKDLNASLAAVYGTDELSDKDVARWHELFRNGFNDLFVTIRDIKRYISSLRLDWSIMGKSDVNKIDFLGIEAVRVFVPRFYDAIPAHKELFIKAPGSLLERMSQDASAMVDARQKRYEELLKNLIDEAVRRNIDGICKVLFPQLESRSTRSDDEWDHELRICSPERFNFYFQLGIPSGEISESEIDGVVESMTNQSAFKALIVQFKEEKRLRKVLGKLVRHGKTLGEEKLQNALAVLWKMEKQIDDEPEVGFDIDTSTEICQLGYNALKELPGSNRKHLLAALIRGCPNIFYPAHFLVELRRDLGKQGAENAILNDNDLKELEEILLGKIKNAAQNGSLKDEKRLVGLLYRWRAWESAEAVSEYIRALISSSAGLLTFLKAFVSKMISSAGNYNYLNRNSINELYPIGEIESLVNGITDEELAQMMPQEKEAIDLFRHPRR